MSEEERRALLAKMEASIEEAKILTPEEAKGRLIAEGLLNDEGKLAAEYGGEEDGD
jgi:hypothetical protein